MQSANNDRPTDTSKPLFEQYLSATFPGAPPRLDTWQQSRRRRIVAAIVVVVGGVVYYWALNIEPGNSTFYLGTLLLAAVWMAGAWASGPLHFGRDPVRGRERPVVAAVVVAVALIAIFLVGALVVGSIDWLRDPVVRLLEHASSGSPLIIAAITFINGIAEEMFFRGTVYDAVRGRMAVVISTAIYTLITALTGILLLVLAALILGTICGWLRRLTGGIFAPAVAHVTWSITMLFLLPEILTAV